MAIDADKAIELAKTHLADEFRNNLEVAAAQLPAGAIYGFDPEGWSLFVVFDSHRVGSSEYVAVNMETGEAKSLGRYGE